MSGNVAFRKGSEHSWVPTYCYIKEEDGGLMAESELAGGPHRTLVPDLRGCQVKCLVDGETQIPYLEIIIPTSTVEVHLRLLTQSDLDSWFAALLCWQPIRPKGMLNKMTKPQAALLSARPAGAAVRHNSEHTLLKEAPVIKVGRMIFWDANVAFPTGPIFKPSHGRSIPHRVAPEGAKNYGSRWWRRVSCTLRENGELKLFTEADNQLVSVVQLSHLSRSAVQRLDSSVLNSDYCIAIYPQYASDSGASGQQPPIFVSLETRILYEVWFVLLRAFTIPQLYGPKPPSEDEGDKSRADEQYERLLANSRADIFRMERALSIRILEAKVQEDAAKSSPDLSGFGFRADQSSKAGIVGSVYVEIQLDGETRAKTQPKPSLSPFWAQDFDFLDLPAVLSSTTVILKHRPPDGPSGRGIHNELRMIQEAYGAAQTPQSTSAASGYTGLINDRTLGKVEIVLEELEARKDIDQRWTVINASGLRVGEILIRARAEENVILMRQEYEPLSQLLHAFGNGLTVQIALAIPSELKRLSDCLLNIFQVSGRATEWLMALVEDEIDGLSKETPLSKVRYAQRMGSIEQDRTRELLVRDLNKNATLEANLLFRGNTLLTKALDTHMRRVGVDYLHQSLGTVIFNINDRDPECEVDPNKMQNEHDMKRNWHRLLTITEEVWKAIYASAQKCPAELRFIFRHIKACAEDRYGDFLRTVSYSSVSGFLFLRFFVPAILNPRMFGLLKGMFIHHVTAR